MISKTERTELKSIVRGQFKVLRAEIEQREAELLAELETEIAQRFSEEDDAWATVQHRIHEAVMAANREVNNALYEAGFQTKGHTERLWVQSPAIAQPVNDRQALRMEGAKHIRARVKGAGLRLDRQEADLLRTLAIGAIESEEAREFLTAIPTAAELVPAARLRELEASLVDEEES